MNNTNKLDQAYRTNTIIAYALAGSLLLYALIVEFFKFKGMAFNLFPGPLMDKLRFFCVFLSFAAYFIINYFNRKFLVKKPGASHEALLAKLTLANIVSLALSELPALCGFLLFLGSGNSRDFYLLLLISLLLFYAFFPRYGFWANWSRVGANNP